MRLKFLLVLLFLYSFVYGQSQTKRALFLGNSYTAVNNLPQMIANVAYSTGDTLLFDSNCPGGYRFLGHSTNATSLAKIAVGNWDYVVLQEQSQFPSFPDGQVEAEVFPYARQLDSIINAQNPCAETVFYMTWGRKNGDASNCSNWPPVCTYSGMDSLLSLRYRMMADSNQAILSPVGAVWKYLRQNSPLIDLYSSDESHPSVAGTYAAACSFYAALFRKNPTLIGFNSGLSISDAATIRAAAKAVVFDSLLKWHIGDYDPRADFSQVINGGNQVSFTNQTQSASSFVWNFGDGSTSTAANPIHTYTSTGTFVVRLIAEKCGLEDSTSQTIQIGTTGIQDPSDYDKSFTIYPNPATTELNICVNPSLLGSLYVIYDSNGKSILANKISSLKSTILLANLTTNVYAIQVGNGLMRKFNVIRN
jgi:hypothetical protein